MAISNAKDLTLKEVHQTLNLTPQPIGSFTSLSLEPLSDYEQHEFEQIREDFSRHWVAGRVPQGLIKALTVFPLLRLAGFYRSSLEFSLQENIASLQIEEEDRQIRGRMDILGFNSAQINTIPFWILVIESKNSSAEVRQGLPQLLTWAFTNLEHPASAWGLVTNGIQYLFVVLQLGDPATYRLMPELNLLEPDRSIQIIKVLKAICKARS